MSLTANYDPNHNHADFVTEYANGKLNGWNHAGIKCKNASELSLSIRCRLRLRSQSQVQPYYDLANQYTFGSAMFQSNQGPSFPAHQYLVSGTSTIFNGSALRAAENALTRNGIATGGCDSPNGTLVALIDDAGTENQKHFPVSTGRH